MIKDIIEANENAKPNSREMAILKENFPSCFNEDGSFDIERFKEFLSDKVAVTSEGYELKFLGKTYARLLASVDTTTVVVPNEEHNSKPENVESENIYISGDNLDGLKHLLKSYSGKVKCIYIDPPYNTGTDGFVYNDNFNFTMESLSKKLSIDEEHAKRILDLTKRGSASHSAWLMFMYPRLLLARDLLTEDGVIFISIDDNEQANLKLICDELYGEENFIAKFDWRKKTGANDAKDIAVITESILLYTRKKQKTHEYLIWKRDETSRNEERFNRIDEYFKRRGKYYLDTLDRGGLGYIESLDYGIKAPNGEQIFPNDREYKYNDGWRWKWSREKVEWGLENGFFEFVKDNSKRVGYTIKLKNYQFVDNNDEIRKEIGRAFSNLILDPINQIGTNEIKKLFNGQIVFNNPKPIDLVTKLIRTINHEDMIILDFFSGSATTAHATMKLNSKDDGNRRYIMVQLPERVEDKTLAYKAGYKTIDQIGIERIVRAAKAIKEEHPDTTADLGFKHFTLVEPQQNTLDKLEEFDPNENKLFVDENLLDVFGKTTILATWLVRDGYGLSDNTEELEFAGYKGYYIGKHLYLIDTELPDKAIEEIVVKYETDGDFNPENIVLFGYSFTWTEMEALKINLKRLKDTEKNLRINFDIRY